MTPAARIAAAIDVLARWQDGDDGLDRVLAAWGRANRYAGSGDRRAIADLVYDACRRWRSAAWTAGLPEGPRAALIGLCRFQGQDPETLFTGLGHAPSPLEALERNPVDLTAAPPAIRRDLADWMLLELEGVPPAALQAMTERAPLDLRVNTLKGDLGHAIAALAEDSITAVPGPLSATALRVIAGSRQVTGSRAFGDGLVEVMDASSQAVADFAAVRPGETVLDYCAGAGGKTLALAASMSNVGRLLVHDSDPARLARLCPRAARAGASVERLGTDLTPLEGLCDLVLVDAPCSGSGTWRRNPDSKWRLGPSDLEGFAATQAGVLDRAARAVRPGGRLLYTTCSLFRRENGDAVRGFLERHPDFTPDGAPLLLTPLDGGDGFFAARLHRSPV